MSVTVDSLKEDQSLARIPDTTTDPTPEKYFSAGWAAADMEGLKNHIRKGLGSASGEDAILYTEIMEIPNDDLLFLCNACARGCYGKNRRVVVACVFFHVPTHRLLFQPLPRAALASAALALGPAATALSATSPHRLPTPESLSRSNAPHSRWHRRPSHPRTRILVSFACTPSPTPKFHRPPNDSASAFTLPSRTASRPRPARPPLASPHIYTTASTASALDHRARSLLNALYPTQ
ncbi:hypothetical protein C8J57DRAFT_1624886 [Mycena rebaudengoi]|nr:hypothetical protein C8J57DRAFT_1624886 [Mycena rebaudengoi]